MKLVVKKEILLESLNNTARAISTKNLIPILTGIKFDLKDDGLYLYASDTDVFDMQSSCAISSIGGRTSRH